MRIFVSSSFEDLREHRAAAIRVLRQLGHEVFAMEDMTAGSAPPLAKVLEMVDRSEAYVGIFAWRYGFCPARATTAPAGGAASNVPAVEGAIVGETSITHYEYLRAVQRKLPVMAFLLEEQYPWPPKLIDGFDMTRPQALPNADKIRALRQSLQQERVISWFTTPSDLEARVSAAVTTAGLTRQLVLQPATTVDRIAGAPTSAEIGIRDAIMKVEERQYALRIDLAATWWSTRLYLIATLAHRLTPVRRILVVHTKPRAASEGAGTPAPGGPPQANPPAPQVEEIFIGQLSTSGILSTIGPKVAELGVFEEWLRGRPIEYSDLAGEIGELLGGWWTAFGDSVDVHTNEDTRKVNLSAELLRRWFGDSMVQQPLKLADLQRASVVDLLRVLDFPNDYVPVITRREPAAGGQTASADRLEVIDKKALNARLAHSYLVELMDRAHLV